MKARDIVAITIAVGLTSWGLVLMVGLGWRNKSLSEGGGEIFLAIATGLVASLATYMALQNKNGDK